MKKPLLIIFLLCMLCSSLYGIPAQAEDEPLTAGPVNVIEDTSFGAAHLGWTIQEFNDLGFSFGDSVDVILDNGFTLEDIPYYSGYYVPIGNALLCGYPGYPHVALAFNYGGAMWKISEANDDTTATVILREQGKYLLTEELFALYYSDIKQEGQSDEAFSNFRWIANDSIKAGTVFRSASPCDDTHNRAACTDALLAQYGIGCVLNLADSEEEYEAFREEEGYASDYYAALCEEGKVLFLDLNANYMEESFASTLAQGLYEMVQYNAPYLIHCQEGKDRTGFVCALLLALTGSSMESITEDYMETYQNYYFITQQSDPERYEAISEYAYAFYTYLCGTDDVQEISQEELMEGAENYLAWGGLSESQIEELREKLSFTDCLSQ